MSKSNDSEYKIAIFSGFVAIVFTAIYDWVKEKPILSSLWNVLKWLWNNIFEFEVQVWQVLMTFLILLILKNIFNRKDKVVTNKVDWLDYKKDSFDELEWTWGWERGYNNWNIINLRPLCPKCGTKMRMSENYSYNSANCPRCENYLSKVKDSTKIEAIIIDNIQRDLYKKSL